MVSEEFAFEMQQIQIQSCPICGGDIGHSPEMHLSCNKRRLHEEEVSDNLSNES